MSQNNLYQTLKETVLAMVSAYSSPSPFDPEQIWALRTEDCIHSLHPKVTVSSELGAPIAKDQHIEALNHLRQVVERFDLDAQDLIIDVEKRTIAVRIGVSYDLAAVGEEGPDKGRETEVMWIFEMDESGKKVKRIEEFVDQEGFLKGLTERAAKNAESQKKSS